MRRDPAPDHVDPLLRGGVVPEWNRAENPAGRIQMALPDNSASVASACTSTPGMAALTGVGLASLRPAAV
ncbi:MAG: hypothetical protein ABIR05_08120 [Luteimonas sp.]